jgi:hypothetical protein
MALTQKWANIRRDYARLLKRVECEVRKNGYFHAVCMSDQEWVILQIWEEMGALIEHGPYFYPDVNSPACIAKASNDHTNEWTGNLLIELEDENMTGEDPR